MNRSTKKKLDRLESHDKSELNPKFDLQQYIDSRVINWILKNDVLSGKFAKLEWSTSEKNVLWEMLKETIRKKRLMQLKNNKFREFVESIIERGLNTKDVELFFKFRDQLPLRELNWLFTNEDFERLEINGHWQTKRPIPAGFYMLEVSRQGPIFKASKPFQLITTALNDLNTNNVNVKSFKLSVHLNKPSKRLIRLEQESHLTYQSEINGFTANNYKIKLSKLTREFYADRLCKKIGVKMIKNFSEEELGHLLEKYDALMTPSSFSTTHTNYSSYINKIEKQEILNIKKILLKKSK